MIYLDEFLESKRIVVYGTGKSAESLAKESILWEKVAFCISNDFSFKPEFYGKQVFSKDKLISNEHFVIVCSKNFYYEIELELKKIGFKQGDYCSWHSIYSHPNNYLLLKSRGNVYSFQQTFHKKYFLVPIGKFSYSVDKFAQLSKKIGAFVSISGSAVLRANHIMAITTSPFFEMNNKSYNFSQRNKNLESYIEKNVTNQLVIGNDVWIGANTFINASKVKSIGNGAIIGTGAVCLHDIPPYAIMIGCPAKILRYRFSPEQIECLERIKWWEWSNEELENNHELLYDHNLFFEKFMGER